MIVKTRCYKLLKENLVESEDICELKIRGEDGTIYFVKMQKSEKVKDIREELKKVIEGSFKIMSNFPRRIYEEQ